MIPLFKPFMPELPKLNDILMSGKLAYGEYARAFEDKLKEYFNEKYVIVTNTFSSAISVVVTTLELSFGDEVITSPMACLVSTQPYVASGLNIKWCDVDSNRGTISPDCLSKKITKHTKAIIHNHFCGYPGYIDEINAIGREYGIPIIDDGIECFGSEYKGKKIGNCGTDVTVFALSAVRIPNTIDGGIVIFKRREQYEKALRIRDCGIDRARFRDNLGEINPACDISEIGYSATMSNVNGYIGLQQMEYVDLLLEKHRQQGEKWNQFFSEQSKYLPICCEWCRPNYWVYGILADDKIDTIKKFREMGYYASGVHIRNDFYSIFRKQDVSLPGVDYFYKKFVALPSGWWI